MKLCDSEGIEAVTGQMADGWGEGFVQREIECEEGCRLFVDFGAASRNRIKTEQELKGTQTAEQGQAAGQGRLGMEMT